MANIINVNVSVPAGYEFSVTRSVQNNQEHIDVEVKRIYVDWVDDKKRN